jgi:glutathione S-transferase
MFWAMGWMFWVPLILLFMMMRRRHWRRRQEMRDYRPRFEDVERQQSYIDALESRVSELEARLDFTERLVSTRSAGA